MFLSPALTLSLSHTPSLAYNSPYLTHTLSSEKQAVLLKKTENFRLKVLPGLKAQNSQSQHLLLVTFFLSIALENLVFLAASHVHLCIHPSTYSVLQRLHLTGSDYGD